MYGGMRHMYWWNSRMSLLSQIDCDVIEWNWRHNQVECLVIGILVHLWVELVWKLTRVSGIV